LPKYTVVLKHEFAQVVKKKSFLIMTLLMPALMTALMIIPRMLATREEAVSEKLTIIDRESSGVADEFVEALKKYTIGDTEEPSYMVTDILHIPMAKVDQYNQVYEQLSSQISKKEIKYYMVIMPDAHRDEKNIFLVTNSDNFHTFRRFEKALSPILASRRLKEENINLPVEEVLRLTKRLNLSIKDTRGESIPFMTKFFAALIFIMMMYSMLLTYGTTLMRSVIEEKSSRIMEVLVSSVSPFQLMLGKVIGLGAAAFTQVSIWAIIGIAFFFVGKSTSLKIDPSVGRIVFNPLIAVFFVLFFVGGYLMYSSIFALIGSIVTSDKEAQHFIFPVSILLILPVMVGSSVAQNPYIPWAQVASYIPFCAPTMMMMRIMFIAPSAQIYTGILTEASLSLLLVLITDIALVWVTSRVFRIGILMYGKRPSIREIIRWIRH